MKHKGHGMLKNTLKMPEMNLKNTIYTLSTEKKNHRPCIRQQYQVTVNSS